MLLKEYEVYASETPSQEKAAPQVYKATVFASNEVIAKGKTFSMLRKKYKIKSTGGTILKITEVPQYTDVKARTFKVTGVYRSKTALHNVIKEIRAITKVLAVEKFYQDLRSRHSAQPSTITIVEVEEIEREDITSKDILQVLNDPKYPLFDKRVPPTAPDFQLVPLDRE